MLENYGVKKKVNNQVFLNFIFSVPYWKIFFKNYKLFLQHIWCNF